MTTYSSISIEGEGTLSTNNAIFENDQNNDQIDRTSFNSDSIDVEVESDYEDERTGTANHFSCTVG